MTKACKPCHNYGPGLRQGCAGLAYKAAAGLLQGWRLRAADGVSAHSGNHQCSFMSYHALQWLDQVPVARMFEVAWTRSQAATSSTRTQNTFC
jgi:hypothetical protein